MPALAIDGLFFRACDPEALNAWYREHLGIGAERDHPESGRFARVDDPQGNAIERWQPPA